MIGHNPMLGEALPKKRTPPKLMATTIPDTSSCGMKLHNLVEVKNLGEIRKKNLWVNLSMIVVLLFP